MRETQQNIKRYKEQLVNVKSKIAAAGLFFLMSCLMMTTATFAWLTLSMSPEVTGISTTVAGNGNLEIALAGNVDEYGDLIRPNESSTIDGNLPIIEKNITWGNLINLSDPAYGLGSAVLKPAALNYNETLRSPLLAMEYTSDGRVFTSNSQFSYATYDSTENKFLIPDKTKYGVRAISSVIYSSSNEAMKDNLETINRLNALLNNVHSLYTPIVTNDSYLNSIAAIMGAYLTDKFNPSYEPLQNPKIEAKDVTNMISMLEAFTEAQAALADLFVEIAKVQIEARGLNIGPYNTLKDLVDNASTLEQAGIILGYQYKENGTIVKDPIDYIKLYDDINAVQEVIKTVKNANSDNSVYLKDIIGNTKTGADKIYGINDLVEISTCVVYVDLDGKGLEPKTLDQLAKYGTADLAGLSNGTFKAVIKDGALERFEHLAGGKMLDKAKLKIEAKKRVVSMNITAPATVYANITTLAKDIEVAGKPVVPALIGNSSDKEEYSVYGILLGNTTMLATAADVYGMAIDLWVRTNVDKSYLLLEGQAQIQLHPLMASMNGKDYYVYEDVDGNKFYHVPTTNVLDPTDMLETYKKVNKETGLTYFQTNVPSHLNSGDFYNYSTGQLKKFVKYDDSGKESPDPEARAEFVASLINYAIRTEITGYDGVNRVWEEQEGATNGTSATQGKGSCFIFQSSDPLEQESMMKVLAALSVAFIDDGGNVLAIANLNPEHAYEESGKVTLPLELNDAGKFIENEEGEKTYYITPLTQNNSHYISAVVYIDGNKISNKDISATKDVSGYLNLQFGSNVDLSGMEDDEVKSAYIKVNGSVDKDFFTVDEIPAQSNLSITVDGIAADRVVANFSRKVNDYQGVKMEPLVLTRTGGNGTNTTWQGTQTFNTPGTYVLNSVWVDGVEYDLPKPADAKDAITIEVEGFKLGDVTWSESNNEVYVMSSNSAYEVETTVAMSYSDIFAPDKAEAIFKNEYNEYVNIKLNLDRANDNNYYWKGKGSFITSGKYILEYVRVDGEIYYIEESSQKKLNLSLGVYANVELDENHLEFEWTADETQASKNIVPITSVEIFDNKGNELLDLNDVKIYYAVPGSIDPREEKLTWDGDKFVGNFNIQSPGVYSFDKITIGSDSVIRKATGAPSINAKSPYPIEFVENSLKHNEYVLAPNDDASMSVQIKNSYNSNKVVALFVYDNDDVLDTTLREKYVTGVAGTPISLGNNETVTTWTFTPTISDDSELQDGKWTIKEVYVSEAYYEGEWYSSTVLDEDDNVDLDTPWYKVTDLSKKNRITWDVADETMYVLNDINIAITNEYAKDTNGKELPFTGPFTTSLSGAYYGTNYQISYTNNSGDTLSISDKDNPMFSLDNYGVIIDSTKLYYEFAENQEVFGTKGWWTASSSGTVANLLSTYKQTDLPGYTINFNENDKDVVFKYPGDYTPKINITMSVKKLGTTTSTAITSVSKGISTGEYGGSELGTNNFINITNSVKSKTLIWDRPDVRFTSFSPTTTRKVFTGKFGGLFEGFAPKTENKNNSIDTNTNTINAYFSVTGGIHYVNYDQGTTATVTLTNGGTEFKTATCTLNTTYDVKFVFSAGGTTASDIIGHNAGGTGGDTLRTIPGAECTSIVFTLNDNSTYTFTLPLSLKVGENK